ncbi:carboxylesterase family protein [Gynurincola endophyticus]|jgi:predicted peptidase|uniref:carboxylesterase family protein n=1 Tax=Gynurincola endophyticus TaxID=2479004 RepID=UPI000F8E23E5|nr:dienelactone hydrolase family protein [Gynurincola endophyticus]
MLKLIIGCLLCVFSLNTMAQNLDLFEKKVYVSPAGDSLPYRILYPENYNPKKKYPLLIVLHGAGERGNNNTAQLVHGGSLFVNEANRSAFPAIVVFPQCPADSYWSNVTFRYDDKGKRTFVYDIYNPPTKAMSALMSFIQADLLKRKIESKRVYVMGLSMGGMGTYELVYRMPKTFAAAVPICGGGDIRSAANLTKPVWRIYHGEVDDVVPPQLSVDMYDAIVLAGGKATIKIYPGVNHGSWNSVFAEPDLLQWIFKQKK